MTAVRSAAPTPLRMCARKQSGAHLRSKGRTIIFITMNDRLDTEERRELPDSVYGLPERREYPMPDAAHVRAAEAYFRYCPEELKPRLARAILRFAAEYGVDVESPTVRRYAAE